MDKFNFIPLQSFHRDETGKKHVTFPKGFKWGEYTTSLYTGPLGEHKAIITGEISNLTILDFDNVGAYCELCSRANITKEQLFETAGIIMKTSRGYQLFYSYTPSISTDIPQLDILNDKHLTFAVEGNEGYTMIKNEKLSQIPTFITDVLQQDDTEITICNYDEGCDNYPPIRNLIKAFLHSNLTPKQTTLFEQIFFKGETFASIKENSTKESGRHNKLVYCVGILSKNKSIDEDLAIKALKKLYTLISPDDNIKSYQTLLLKDFIYDSAFENQYKQQKDLERISQQQEQNTLRKASRAESRDIAKQKKLERESYIDSIIVEKALSYGLLPCITRLEDKKPRGSILVFEEIALLDLRKNKYFPFRSLENLKAHLVFETKDKDFRELRKEVLKSYTLTFDTTKQFFEIDEEEATINLASAPQGCLEVQKLAEQIENKTLPPLQQLPEGVIKTIIHNVFPDAEMRDLFLHNIAYHARTLTKANTCFTALGETQGTGKSLLFGNILAKHLYKGASSVITGEMLQSQFNDYIFNNLFLFVEEIEASQNKLLTPVLTKLKTYIANDTLSIHCKGKAATNQDNRLMICLASNSELPFKLDTSDNRRFNFSATTDNKLHDILPVNLRGKDISKNIEAEIPSFYHYLASIQLDYSNYNKTLKPQIQQELQELSTPLYKLAIDKLLKGGIDELVKFDDEFANKVLFAKKEKVEGTYIPTSIFSYFGDAGSRLAVRYLKQKKIECKVIKDPIMKKAIRAFRIDNSLLELHLEEDTTNTQLNQKGESMTIQNSDNKVIEALTKQIQELKDEIARLKSNTSAQNTDPVEITDPFTENTPHTPVQPKEQTIEDIVAEYDEFFECKKGDLPDEDKVELYRNIVEEHAEQYSHLCDFKNNTYAKIEAYLNYKRQHAK